MVNTAWQLINTWLYLHMIKVHFISFTMFFGLQQPAHNRHDSHTGSATFSINMPYQVGSVSFSHSHITYLLPHYGLLDKIDINSDIQ